MNCEISLGSRPSKIPNLIIVLFLQKHVEIELDYEIQGIFFSYQCNCNWVSLITDSKMKYFENLRSDIPIFLIGLTGFQLYLSEQ